MSKVLSKLLFCLLIFSCAFLPELSLSRQVVKRVVSSSLASDEILIDLMGESDRHRLAAVSRLAVDKQYSNVYGKVPKSIMFFQNDVEELVRMKPDLIVLSTYNDVGTSSVLKSLQIKTHVLKDFSSLDDIVQNIKTLARLVGLEERGSDLTVKFKETLKSESLKAKAKGCKTPPSVISYDGSNSIMGLNTIFDSAMNVAGVQNLGSKIGVRGFANIKDDQLVTLQPDYIIAGGEYDHTVNIVKEIQNKAGWKYLKAVKAGNIIVVPERYLMSVSHYVTRLISTVNDTVSCQ